MPEARNRMYSEFADLWTLISAPEDYAAEAAIWRDTLFAKLGPGRHRILEMGVGGGNNLSHLTPYFDATAVDLSPDMLKNSMRLNPGVEHHVGDMRNVRLGRTFDAVLVHDAASYLLSREDVERTCETARAHLRPGGVFMAAPDWVRENFSETADFTERRTAGDVSLAYMEYAHDPDPSDTTIEVVYVYVIKRGRTVHVEEDRHTLGLLSVQTWLDVMGGCGFDTGMTAYGVHDDGRDSHIFTGVLRGAS